MEIRPYRSQVRATPVMSAEQATPDLTKGARMNVYGGIAEGGGKLAAEAYDIYDAQKKRDFNVAAKANQQNIQQALFDVALPNIQKYLDEQSKNPAQVFYQQDKDVDQVWNYEIEKARENTIGQITDPKQKAEAELYFNTMKGAAAVTVEDLTVAHKNKAAAFVLGKDNGDQIALAINGDDHMQDIALANISRNLGEMVDRGIIGRDQLEPEYQKAKTQIADGRTLNTINSMLANPDYGYDMAKLKADVLPQIEKIQDKDTKAKAKANLDDHINILKAERQGVQAAAYEEGLNRFANGTLTAEYCLGDDLKAIPGLGIEDKQKPLLSLLDTQRDKAKQETDKRWLKARGDIYNQMVQNINAGKGDLAEIESYVGFLGSHPERSGGSEDLVTKLKNALDKYNKDNTPADGLNIDISGGSGLSRAEGINDLVTFLYNNALITPDKGVDILNEYGRYAGVTADDMNKMANILTNKNAPLDARLKVQWDRMLGYAKEHPENSAEIDLLCDAMLAAVAEQAMGKVVDGKRVLMNKLDQDALLERVKDYVDSVTGYGGILDALGELKITKNPPRFKEQGAGYTMVTDDEFRNLINSAGYLEFAPADDERVRDNRKKLTQAMQSAVQAAVGEDDNMSDYMLHINKGEPGLIKGNRKTGYTAYFIDNDQIYKATSQDGSAWTNPELVIPKTIQNIQDERADALGVTPQQLQDKDVRKATEAAYAWKDNAEAIRSKQVVNERIDMLNRMIEQYKDRPDIVEILERGLAEFRQWASGRFGE